MGINFRGRGVERRVRIGKRTVKDGEAVAVWDQHGRHTQIVGPRLVRLWWSTIRFLDRHVAGSGEYLRVRHFDGTIEHVRGPTALFENPVYHLGVSVEQAVRLEDNTQYLVLQRGAEPAPGKQASGASAVAAAQVVIAGPAMFFPEATDVVRIFGWAANGAGALLQGGRALSLKLPIDRKLNLQLLGADGHSATANVTLRARLVSVEGVLAIPDPIAEADTVTQTVVHNAVSKVHFSAKSSGSLASALQGAVSAPGMVEELRAQLRERAGCDLLGIGVQEVTPSAELAKLRGREDEIAIAQVSEQIADAALTAASARQEREHELEAKRQAQDLRLQAERLAAAGTAKEAELKQQLNYLKELHSLDVDLTRYLVSQNGKGDDVVAGELINSKPPPAGGLFCCSGPGAGKKRS